MEGFRILIVDDEEELGSILAERLALRGFQAETVVSGADALRHVGENEFSAMILDLKMPGIDGLELMAEIKRTHPDLPVILFTGYGSVADARKGMKAGAFDYIMKPVDIDELVEKIRSAVGTKKD